MNKKVLHVFHSINHSGAEIMYQAAAPLFQEAGFELHAVSTGKVKGTFVKEMENAGVTVHHYPFERKYSFVYLYRMLIYFVRFYQFVKKNKISVIHIHRNHLFWAFALAGKMAGVKTLIRTVHSVFRPPVYRWHSYLLARHLTNLLLNVKITSISPSVFDNEKTRFKNRTILIQNWYNPYKFFKPFDINEMEQTRIKFDYSPNIKILLSIGYCIHQKRHYDILKAISMLNKSSIRFLYLHIGSGSLENHEKKLAKELGVEESVIFLGNKNNIREYLLLSDVFLMPSDYEGVGIAAMEAIAVGVPIIAYKVSGLTELLESVGLTDNLIPKDYQCLAAKIDEVTNNRSHFQKLANNAASLVKEKYGMHANVKHFITLYNGGQVIDNQ